MLNPTKKEIEDILREKYPDIEDEEMELRVKVERRYQEKHLKAYLKGQTRFSFGVDPRKQPVYFPVEDGSKKKEVNQQKKEE